MKECTGICFPLKYTFRCGFVPAISTVRAYKMSKFPWSIPDMSKRSNSGRYVIFVCPRCPLAGTTVGSGRVCEFSLNVILN